MIKLSNGHIFEYMAASGALGFDGRGWWWEKPLKYINLFDASLFTPVTKTLTLRPIEGNVRWYNPFQCVRFIRGGVVNAVGLSNPGIDWWLKKIGPTINSDKTFLIVSILGEPRELLEMAKRLNDFNLAGIEINASCPNTKTDILRNATKIIASCEIVKKNSRHPIILKMSVAHNRKLIVKMVEDIIEAIAINSVPWKRIFPDNQSPLEKFGGGGVSGKVAQPFTWGLVKSIAESTSIPVIGPSIWNFNDIDKVRSIGAEAISFGSVFLCYPWRPTLYAREDIKRRKKLRRKFI